MKVYLVEVGVLLNKDDKEFDYYSTAYDEKHGYYDENQFYQIDYGEALQYVQDYVKNGVNNIYGIISETELDGEFTQKELDNDVCVEGEFYEVGDVKYSLCKINNDIKENFLFGQLNQENSDNIYRELFLKRWKELENQIVLEKEDGETTFLEKDVFPQFFISPELLVGFYVWREGYSSDGLQGAYELFIEEYDGWIDECKEIAAQAKDIFEKECLKENNNFALNNEDVEIDI